jgi:hypothetical protein
MSLPRRSDITLIARILLCCGIGGLIVMSTEAVAATRPQRLAGATGLQRSAAARCARAPRAPDRAPEEAPARWAFSVVGGLAAREVGGRGFWVPYVGFWAADRKRNNLEIVYEGFVLTPSTRTRGPTGIGFAPELDMAGTSTLSVDDIAYGALIRVNYYFREGRVRPYVTIGGGGVFHRRSSVWTTVRWQLPAGVPMTETRRRSEDLFGFSSVGGVGVSVELADGWILSPEARVPFVPAPGFAVTSSIALVVGLEVWGGHRGGETR